MEKIVHIFVFLFQAYLLIGVIAAFVIQFKGLKSIDPSTENAGFWFRLITFPGMVGLWPVVLYKWFKAN